VVLIAGFFKDVLGNDEAMGHEAPEPVRDANNIVVPSLLVNGGHDLIDLGVDGRVVSHLPVQEGIVACGGCIEVVWAPHCHDS
jgi:hypothetical protein